MICLLLFFFSSRRRHTRYIGDWSSDVCSSDLTSGRPLKPNATRISVVTGLTRVEVAAILAAGDDETLDRKSTRLNSSHRCISYAVFCLKKKKKKKNKDI